MTEWVEFLKKITVETDTRPFATTEDYRTVTTERTWLISREALEVLGLARGIEALKELPET